MAQPVRAVRIVRGQGLVRLDDLAHGLAELSREVLGSELCFSAKSEGLTPSSSLDLACKSGRWKPSTAPLSISMSVANRIA
jgi:hypothetical protein